MNFKRKFKLKKKILVGVMPIFLLGILSGCTSTEISEINILATTDLHGEIPYNLSEYIKEEKKKEPNSILVDAGDFFDIGIGEMGKYFDDRDDYIRQGKEKHLEVPIANTMKELGYDSVVLGNHEFVANNRFYLDSMISDFEKNKINVLSANTYRDSGENYTKPYTIKEVETENGKVKLGILGLTIKEVAEAKDIDENGNLVKAKSRELKDMPGYEGKLYINDLVDEANKWTKIMKEKEKTDLIVAVVHSGERPKKPRNPGNRIQEIAKEVDGIDAIVAGHTHKTFKQHDYKNKNGDNVIVTQPGKHGECISKITFKLKKDNDKWSVEEKYAELTEFEKDKSDDYAGELYREIASIKSGVDQIKMTDITTFKWDKAYVFNSNMTKEKIYEKVGYEWRDIAKADKDDALQVVFMDGKKVACYFYCDPELMGISMHFDKSDFKDNTVEIYKNKNDKFKVKKGKEVFQTDLTYISK